MEGGVSFYRLYKEHRSILINVSVSGGNAAEQQLRVPKPGTRQIKHFISGNTPAITAIRLLKNMETHFIYF